MKNKIIVVLSLLIMFMVIGRVAAITGSIGNARMILRAEEGETIEKYVRVINVNEVPLEIELFASGDLEEYIEIKDDVFRLEAGEEKKAYFTIEAAEPGTTESRINVQFTPEDDEEKGGVGLSSTVIVITEEEGTLDAEYEEEVEDAEENNEEMEEEVEDDEIEGSGITGDVTNVNVIQMNPITIGLLITGGVLVILVVLLFVAASKVTKKGNKKKKRVKRDE